MKSVALRFTHMLAIKDEEEMPNVTRVILLSLRPSCGLVLHEDYDQ